MNIEVNPQLAQANKTNTFANKLKTTSAEPGSSRDPIKPTSARLKSYEANSPFNLLATKL